MKKIALFLIGLALIACDKIFLEKTPANQPLSNFDVLCTEFKEKYGLFELKNIDWDSLCQQYRTQLNENSTEEELYGVITNLMAQLNDSHVGLLPTNPAFPLYQSGVLGQLDTMNDFNLQVIKEQYLKGAKFEEPFFTYGILEDNIGYIHIEGFSDLPRFLKKPFQKVLNELASTNGLIIDVRGGYGGEDLAGQFFAGHFVSSSIPYMKTRVKAGPTPDDFTDFVTWSLTPQEVLYSKPLVVLTHRFTISARETFCLAMKVVPDVLFIGDATAGAFSNQINRELPNGWGYSLSIGDWRDANGVSHEGIGLLPDLLIKNTKQALLNGKDEVLERAILELR